MWLEQTKATRKQILALNRAIQKRDHQPSASWSKRRLQELRMRGRGAYRYGGNLKIKCKNTGRLLLRQWKKVFVGKELNDLIEFVAANQSTLVKGSSDSRGPSKAIHLGYWQVRGRKDIKVSPLTETPPAIELIERFQAIWKKITELARELDPDFVATLETNIPEIMRPFGAFSMFVWNDIPGVRIHRDHLDFDWCFVFPLGQYEGGATHFEFLNYTAKLRQGDVLAFRSRELWHQVDLWKGERMSGVLFTHSTVLKGAKQYCSWARHTE